MKILLLYSNTSLSSDGFRLITALLRREGHELQIVMIPKQPPMNLSDEELQLLGEFSLKSDLVMIGVYSLFEYIAVRLTKYLKEIRPERLVVWGGPHCINAPEESLQYADGVCYSEGDVAVPQFVRMLESGDPAYLQTPNMAFNVNGSFQVNSLLPLFADLDPLPFYDYSFENEWVLDSTLFPVTKEVFEKYSSLYPLNVPTIYITSTRGCPHHCSYCGNIRYLKMYPELKIRKHSIGRLMAEVEYILKKLPNIQSIAFSDDDFFVRTEQEIHEFSLIYKKDFGLPCAFCISANTFTQEKLIEISKLDNVIVEMGVQSGSQSVIKNVYDRNISLKKVKEVIVEILPFLDKGNLRLMCDFIIDNPYETRSDVLGTYKFIAHLPQTIFINIYSLSFLPGTPLYERGIKDQFISNDIGLNARDFRSWSIKYQINYPTLIILIWQALNFRRILPIWLLLLPTFSPIRFLMRCIPNFLISWMIRKTTIYIKTHGTPVFVLMNLKPLR